VLTVLAVLIGLTLGVGYWLAGSDPAERLRKYGRKLEEAQRSLEAGHRDAAERALDRCPKDLRAWEWHYLKGLCRRPPRVRSLGKVRGDFAMAVLSADGSRVATATGGPAGGVEVKAFATATGVEVYALPLPWVGVRLSDMQLSPDGHYLVLAQGPVHRAMLFIDLRRRTVEANHHVPVDAVAFSPDGKWLARSTNGVQVLEVDRLQRGTLTRGEAMSTEPLFLGGHRGSPLFLAWTPDGKTLAASGPDTHITLWDVVKRETKATLDAEVGGIGIQLKKAKGGIQVTGVLANGAVARDGRIRSGDLITAISDEENKLVGTAGMDIGEFTALARGPVGEEVTVRVRSPWAGGGKGGAVKAETYEFRRTRIPFPVGRLAFSPGGNRLVGWVGGSVLAWDISTGKELVALHGNYLPAAFSPDGRRLLLPRRGGKLRVVDVDTGLDVCTLEGFPDFISSLAFGPEGDTTVAGTRNGEFVVQAPERPPTSPRD
jgi:hypothetical protein